MRLRGGEGGEGGEGKEKRAGSKDAHSETGSPIRAFSLRRTVEHLADPNHIVFGT